MESYSYIDEPTGEIELRTRAEGPRGAIGHCLRVLRPAAKPSA